MEKEVVFQGRDGMLRIIIHRNGTFNDLVVEERQYQTHRTRIQWEREIAAGREWLATDDRIAIESTLCEFALSQMKTIEKLQAELDDTCALRSW